LLNWVQITSFGPCGTKRRHQSVLVADVGSS